MAFDITKFKNLGQFRLFFESVGLIRFFGISTNHLEEIQTKLEQDIEGYEFTKWLIGLLGRKPELSEFDDKDDINGEVLTEDDLHKLTSLELEDFARKIIDQNKSLLKPSGRDSVEHQESESSCDDLLKLFKDYIEKDKKRWQKMFEPFSDGIFGQSTKDAILKNIGLSDQLRKSLSAMNGLSGNLKIEPPVSRLANLPQFENPIDKTNKKLDQVTEILANAAPIAAQCANLIGSLNDAALRMQAEYIKNAKDTQWQTKLSIGVATISLVVTAVFSYISYKDAKEDAKTNQEYIRQLKNEIDLLKQTHSDGVGEIVKVIKETSQQKNIKPVKNKK